MTDIQGEAKRLFETYLAAWNARDFDTVAGCFAEPAVFVLPQQTVYLPERSALITLLEKIFDGLDSAGFSHSTIGEIAAKECGDGLAIVDGRDIRRLRKDGSVIENIDGHYVMKCMDGSWLFVVAIVCERGWQGK